jgi:GcrA cell cycle regulator
MGEGWTEERIEMLKKLLFDGLSLKQIGRELGITRNSVVGKAHRLGLSKGGVPASIAATPVPRGPRRIKRRPQNITPVLAHINRADPGLPPTLSTPTPEDIPMGERKTLMKLLNNDCRWPIGDPRDPDFGFCGAPKCAGSSYCAGHARIAYRKPGEPQPQLRPVQEPPAKPESMAA